MKTIMRPDSVTWNEYLFEQEFIIVVFMAIRAFRTG